MTAITIRNLPEETRRALKVRAAQHGRSTEAEIRLILQAALQPARGLGSALQDGRRRIDLEAAGVDVIDPWAD